MKSIFEQIGGTYTKQGDYCLPNLYLPPEEERPIGIYGQRRLRYLKQHHKILYYNLLTSGKLHSHLADVEEEAQALFSRLVKEYAEKEIEVMPRSFSINGFRVSLPDKSKVSKATFQ